VNPFIHLSTTPWAGDQPMSSSLPTQKKLTSMLLLGFHPRPHCSGGLLHTFLRGCGHRERHFFQYSTFQLYKATRSMDTAATGTSI